MMVKDKMYKKSIESWLKEYVLAYDLCPFAPGPIEKGRVEIKVLYFQKDFDQVLLKELYSFEKQEETDTVLLVIPELENYDDHIEVYYVMQEMIEYDELDVKLVSFHPQSIYGSSGVNHVINYINRAPYAIIQLLKESDLDRLDLSEEKKQEILDKNQKTMERIGANYLSRQIDELRK